MQNLRTFQDMIKKLVAILNKKQKQQGILLFFLLLLVSLLEMLGVSVVIPFIVAMLEPDVILQNQYVIYVMKILRIQDTDKIVYLVGGLIVVVYILKNTMILLVNRFQINYRNTLEKDISIEMLSSYLKRPYTYFLNINSAEVLRGVTSDISAIATILDSVSGFCAEALTCVFIGVFVICLNPFIAICLLFVSGVTALLIVLGFKKKISSCGVETREAFAMRQQSAYQAVNGIKEIMVMRRQKNFLKQYEKASEKACKCNNTYLFISKTPNRLVETVFLGSLVILVCISMKDAGSQADYVSVLGALAVAAVRILPSISNIAGYINGMVYNRVALEAAYENITAAREYCQGEMENNSVYTIDEECMHDRIEINNVSWRYQQNLPLVLKNLSLNIYKGEAIAFIGGSGAGKTTLADVILGLLKPEKGQILVDGHDIYEIPDIWSKMVGYVPQTVFLIDDTIRNNIAFGIAEEEQSEERIWQALEQAQLKSVVEKLENGLDTIVGERGIKFSGGQRQRIAIARALYYDPSILILDEATSALDTETETAVMEAIDALHGRKTLIIVAHRLSTIRNCDKIYEVSNGQVILRNKQEVLNQ